MYECTQKYFWKQDTKSFFFQNSYMISIDKFKLLKASNCHFFIMMFSLGSQLGLSCFVSAVSHFCISWVSVGSMLDLCWVLVVCQFCLSCVSVGSQLFFSWVSVEFYMGFSWISVCSDVLVEYQLSLCKFSLSWVFPIPSWV